MNIVYENDLSSHSYVRDLWLAYHGSYHYNIGRINNINVPMISIRSQIVQFLDLKSKIFLDRKFDGVVTILFLCILLDNRFWLWALHIDRKAEKMQITLSFFVLHSFHDLHWCIQPGEKLHYPVDLYLSSANIKETAQLEISVLVVISIKIVEVV